MGDKIESKKLAKAAGVSIIPGFLGEVHDPQEVLKIGLCNFSFPIDHTKILLLLLLTRHKSKSQRDPIPRHDQGLCRRRWKGNAHRLE